MPCGGDSANNSSNSKETQDFPLGNLCPPNSARSNTLTYEDYLMYAQAHYKTNHRSYARKMEIRRDPEQDKKVREWIREKAAADVEAEEASAETIEPETAPPWTAAPISDENEKAEMRKEREKRAKKDKRAKPSPVEAAIDR
jgi:hypothetical protein